MATNYGKKYLVNVTMRRTTVMDLTTEEKADYDKQQYESQQWALRYADAAWPSAIELAAAAQAALLGNKGLQIAINARIAAVSAKYPIP